MTTHQPIDVAIIGGGPAGYAAAIYAARANLTTTVIEQGISGGQIATTNEVENYPGIPLLSGAELGERFQQHAEGLGAQVTWSMVTGIDYDADEALFTVHQIWAIRWPRALSLAWVPRRDLLVLLARICIAVVAFLIARRAMACSFAASRFLSSVAVMLPARKPCSCQKSPAA